MNKKHKILLSIILILLYFGSGLFTYYNVVDRREVEKSITWKDYISDKFPKIVRLYNEITKKYDTYKIDKVNIEGIKTISKDIIKEVNQRSKTKLEKYELPQILEYDIGNYVTLSNIIIEPIYNKEKSWHEELVSIRRIYNDLSDADLYNIPKMITLKNENWFLLTDDVKFDIDNDKYQCMATYSKINRVEEEESSIKEYNIKGIYKGKLITKIGKVNLRYKEVKIINKSEVIKRFSLSIFLITTGTILSLYLSKFLNKHLLNRK